MAKCALCEKSGWFLKISAEGLCDTCAQAHSLEMDSSLRVIKQSLNIASETKSSIPCYRDLMLQKTRVDNF